MYLDGITDTSAVRVLVEEHLVLVRHRFGVRIVFGHIEPHQDVPKMFLLSPNMFV